MNNIPPVIAATEPYGGPYDRQYIPFVLHPLDYHVYVRHRRAVPAGEEPGPLLGFQEWWPLVQELAERAAVGEMIGEGDASVTELRRVLLVNEVHTL